MNYTLPQNIEEELQRFNYSDTNVQQLKRFYDNPSFFEISGISRSETKHSYFLKWLLIGKDFNCSPSNNPICSLLNILVKRAVEQNKSANVLHFSDLQAAVASGSLEISNIDITLEDITQKSQGEKPDLVIDFTTQGFVSGNRNCRIVIENKVGSVEHKCSTGSWQTDQYCANYKKKNTIVFYLYLTAISPKRLASYGLLDSPDQTCKNANFVHICYQDLLDEIILPLYNSPVSYSDIARFRLKEYIDTLTIPTSEENCNKRYVMAVSSSEYEMARALWGSYMPIICNSIEVGYKYQHDALLLKFWEKNQILIKAIVEILFFMASDKLNCCHNLYTLNAIVNKTQTLPRYIIGDNMDSFDFKGAAIELATRWADYRGNESAQYFNAKISHSGSGRAVTKFSDTAKGNYEKLNCPNRKQDIYFSTLNWIEKSLGDFKQKVETDMANQFPLIDKI